MSESVEALERRIDDLRTAVRRSVIAGDRERANALRVDLRAAERAWESALAAIAKETDQAVVSAVDQAVTAVGRADDGERRRQFAPLLSVREQVHHALTLLSVPAAPKLIAEVHAAFFHAVGRAEEPPISGAKLTHLRRDEERSYRTAPGSRPYYLCSALTADHLAPARGLLAVSTWPLETRIIGPLSPRVDFLTAAVNVAERAASMPGRNRAVARLVWRFAASIPGAVAGAFDKVKPEAVGEAARAELKVHADADRSHRQAAAKRARKQLDEVEQLFGSRLRVIKGSA